MNVSDAVHSIRSLYKLLSSYRDRGMFRTLSAFCKKNNFQGREGFVELGHFDKYFVKNARKKVPQGNISEFFLLDTLKTAF